jgi:hypothetical protein
MSVFSEIQKTYTVPEILAIYQQTKEALEYHCRELNAVLQAAENAGISVATYRVNMFLDDRLVELKRSTWRALLAASGVERVLCVSRLERFDQFLDGNGNGVRSIPEPSEEAVMELLAGGVAKQLFAEMIREAFDFLRPGANYYDTYKTNKKNGRVSVGKKIILKGIIHETTYYVNIYLRTRRHLIQVDKIFHLLDGKNFPFNNTYSSPLVDGLSARKGETDYFKWERYGNGNLHLTFKRDDLLKMFNQIAGGLVEPVFGDGAV